MSLDKFKKIVKETDDLVLRVIQSYNKNNFDKPAIKGGSRKVRNEAEQRVLDSFNLK